MKIGLLKVRDVSTEPLVSGFGPVRVCIQPRFEHEDVPVSSKAWKRNRRSLPVLRNHPGLAQVRDDFPRVRTHRAPAPGRIPHFAKCGILLGCGVPQRMSGVIQLRRRSQGLENSAVLC